MTAQIKIPLSKILDAGKPPAEWVKLLAERGIEISERALREKANRLGACYKLGRAMIIMPDHIDVILKGGDQCQSNRTEEARLGGRGGASSTTAPQSPTITDAALAHLTKLARGDGASKKRKSGSVITFSEMKRR